jgi:hypothetical protein
VRLLAPGDTWQYAVDTSLPFNWFSPNYDDSAWSVGSSPLGYGNGNEATLLPANSTATVYFRRRFNVAMPSQLMSAVRLSLLVDDGAVVYLNGLELTRFNMPRGPVTPFTFATVAVEGAGEVPRLLVVPSSRLLQGVNTIAVEVHQAARVTAIDMTMDVELNATLRADVLSRGPYLQRDAFDTIIVRFRLSSLLSAAVRYGNATFEAVVPSNAVPTGGNPRVVHSVVLPLLQPGSEYWYCVATAAGVPLTQRTAFRSAPAEGASGSYRVWAIGDPGTNAPPQLRVRDAFLRHTPLPQLSLWLVLGDTAYPKGVCRGCH